MHEHRLSTPPVSVYLYISSNFAGYRRVAVAVEEVVLYLKVVSHFE